jgi:hypothetical protein
VVPVDDVVRVLFLLTLLAVEYPVALDRPASRMFSGDSGNSRGFMSSGPPPTSAVSPVSVSLIPATAKSSRALR